MNASGLTLQQQAQHASDSRSATLELTAYNECDVLPETGAVAPPPLASHLPPGAAETDSIPSDAPEQVSPAANDAPPQAVYTFAAPPPLSRQRSNVKRSYTSLVAMVSQSESLLPPPNVVTPSSVREEEINDKRAVSDLCTVLDAGDGIVVSSPDSPSLARSTFYSNRSISAQDVVNAIEELWGLTQLPSIVIDE